MSANNYWGTERVKSFPQTIEGLEQLWSDIRAEFRPRSAGREGCLYTNHQGFIAVQATIKSTQGGRDPLAIDGADGVTSSLRYAATIAEALKFESRFWPGKAGENLDKLAGLYSDAIGDALDKHRRAVSVIDTSSNGHLDKPSLWYERYKRRHEATHIWQFSVNSGNLGLISEQEMKADPDYPLLSRGLAGYYSNMTAEDVYAEAVAIAVAGAGWMVGFRTKVNAEAFLNRYFKQVIQVYDEKVLDTLHLVHPHVRRVINHVTSIAADLGRREERASGKDVRNSAGGDGEANGTDEPAARESRRVRVSQEHVAGEWSGDRGAKRDAGREQIVANAGRVLTSKHSDQSLKGYGNSGSELPTTDRTSAYLITALGKISTLEAADPSGLRTWKELALSASNIAREAITDAATVQPMKERELVLALEKIAALAPIDSQGVRHSWKEMTLTASAIAREAIEKTYLMTNSAEATNTYQNEQRRPAHSQGVGW